jgi:hypothetical protein
MDRDVCYEGILDNFNAWLKEGFPFTHTRIPDDPGQLEGRRVDQCRLPG